jgi:hypothetical protein
MVRKGDVLEGLSSPERVDAVVVRSNDEGGDDDGEHRGDVGH